VNIITVIIFTLAQQYGGKAQKAFIGWSLKKEQNLGGSIDGKVFHKFYVHSSIVM
jgi:hypothetical protein